MHIPRWLLLSVFVVVQAPSGAWAHGGGLDGYGCHHNRKAGGYHCHRGPFAGQAFASQDEMLQHLGQEQEPPLLEPQDPAQPETPAPQGVVPSACPPEGRGGDPVLNRLKNRTTAPSKYQEITVEQFLRDLTPDLHTPKHRDRFSSATRAYVDEHEQQGLALVGYLLGAKQSGPESTNCHDPRRRDFHVWIGAEKPSTPDDANRMRSASVVVEPTPDGQEHHPGWRLRMLQRLAQQGAKVRISGWAMYDPEHPDQLGTTRGTLWEVHPVMKIEVWSDGQWRAL